MTRYFRQTRTSFVRAGWKCSQWLLESDLGKRLLHHSKKYIKLRMDSEADDSDKQHINNGWEEAMDEVLEIDLQIDSSKLRWHTHVVLLVDTLSSRRTCLHPGV